MKLHMQILIALGLGIKRNGHIFLGLIAGIILGIAMHAFQVSRESSTVYSVIYSVLNPVRIFLPRRVCFPIFSPTFCR